MDEPMEESSGDGQCGNSNVCDSTSTPPPQQAKVSESVTPSILRPGSMVMMTITVEDYETQYWPKLYGAINQLLTMKPGDSIHISYEQMYSCVYKCVCKQFSERLYKDLFDQITQHLETLCQSLQNNNPCQYIDSFNFGMNQYLQALGGIVPIFNYMNRFFVQSKLKTDLNVELRKLFVITVADKHVPILIPLLVDASSKPFSISPPVMANLIKNLYELKPEFAQLRPQLFARYIPSVLPPCRAEELDQYIEEVQRMQRDLRTHPDFICGDQTRKRSGDDDLPKTTSVNFFPKNHNTGLNEC